MRISRKPFEESFRTAFKFIENPRILWDSGKKQHHKKLFRLTFAERIAYSRKEGLRTAETTLPFKALQAISEWRASVDETDNYVSAGAL